VIPDIIIDVADLADDSEQLDNLAQDDLADPSYGASLSFDWRNMRLRVDLSGNPLVVTGQESLVEDLVKAILTERYRYSLYSDDYGAEFWELIGAERDLAETDVVRILQEVCTLDPRVRAVESITVTPGANAALFVKFSIRDFTDTIVHVPEFTVRYG